MPKASKTSASSATRKKHAKKAGDHSNANNVSQNTASKPSKKEIKKGLAPPPKKSYIPPSKLKPTPPQKDPLDSLTSLLPSDLVVILRRLAKKDAITKGRALDELEAWIRRAKKEGSGISESTDIEVLVVMLPIWLHRYPALCVHPSRRIRHLAASLHAQLLEISDVRTNVFAFLREVGPEMQVSQILGCWCFSAWDIDRAVASRGARSWNNAVIIRQNNPSDHDSEQDEASRFVVDDFTLTRYILPFTIMTVMDPELSFSALNPSTSAISDGSATSSPFGTPRRGGPTASGVPSGSISRKGLSGEDSSFVVSRAEDELESVEDRNARLRVAAMGTLTWVLDKCIPTPTLVESLHSLFSSSLFWTVLHYGACPPFYQSTRPVSDTGEAGVPSNVTQGFGLGQTIVRRAAWGIVYALVGNRGSKSNDERWKVWISQTDPDDKEHGLLGLISSAILRSAFVEPDSVVRSCMWEPLLMFLTKINDAWVANYEYESSALSGQSHDFGSDSTPDSPMDRTAGILLDPSADTDERRLGSAAYAEFLTFLGLGCNGSPIQGYPTLLVILSTMLGQIMSPTLPSLLGFFDALWSAIDGQALSTLSSERIKSTEAFLRAWGECLVWTIGTLIKGSHETETVTTEGGGFDRPTDDTLSSEMLSKETSRALVSAQFGKLVDGLGAALRIDGSIAGARISVVFEKLENFASDLLHEVWIHISKYARTTISGSGDDERRIQYALSFLAALHQHMESEVSKHELERLVSGIAEEVLKKCHFHSNTDGADVEESVEKDGRTVELLLEWFGSILSLDEGFIQLLDDLLTTEMSSLISRPSLVLSYLKNRADPARRLAIWHILLSTLGSSSSLDMEKKIGIFSVLLATAHQPDLVAWARPSGHELQGFTEQLLAEAFNDNSTATSLIATLIKNPDPFIDTSTVQSLVSSIVSTIGSAIPLFIRNLSMSLQMLRISLKLLLSLLQDIPSTPHTKPFLGDILPHVFVLAFLMPHCSSYEEEEEVEALAEQLWNSWKGQSESQTRAAVTCGVKQLLKSLLIDTDVRPRPVAILQAISHVDINVIPLVDVIPTSSEFNIMLSSTSTDHIDASLAIIEPLAPPSIMNASSRKVQWNGGFDSSGFSPYARGVTALLHILTTDRSIARENMWTLQHILTLALFANEVLKVPGVGSPAFHGQVTAVSELKDIIRLTQQVATLLLTNPGEGSWHQDVVDALSGKKLHTKLGSVGDFVRLVFEQSKLDDTVRDSLVFRTVLQHVLRNATKEDADRWIELARDIEGRALQTSLAISFAVNESALEPPKLDRYRNELASKLSGIPPNKANTTGLRLLRCLSAVAPNAESDVIFIPQQRAVYLVQAVQAWMGSDEDLDEMVANEVTLALFNLAPILQNVQGAHWDFIMDLIESNLEDSSFNDASTLVMSSRTFRLLKLIRDLAFSNKYLKEVWNQRSRPILAMVRDLLAVKTTGMSLSIPQVMCREQALLLVLDLPGSLMDANTLATMTHLLSDPSIDNQKMAYQMLQQAAATRTEHLVIEAGVDSEKISIIELPHELMAMLQVNVNFGGTDVGGQDPFAYLLGWMTVFDLFIGASLRVKTAYVDHLRSLNVIGDYFLPNIFELLGVGGSGGSFKLDQWVVGEYWLPFYEADASPSLQLLAAHVYHRALLTVPSLVRTWWEDLKDRQHSAAIATFTSSYFSPVLIASELIHVKPASRADTATAGDEPLSDETFNVKVALAVNEVTATYTVDDQQMEIGIKLPTGYPLKTVDVKPIRRVGVQEKVWRKWLFALQQVVTSHNGRIVDGLALFKKTVNLHFEGQVECAICYSILHVVDRSLPSKPCRTCKNRFHAGCLYKWFNTSHSSSCPLCRSDIM